MRHSVAGIAITHDKVFIARRKAGGDLGGKWEFPGGKAEAGEGDEDALAREYREEFGVAVEVGPLLGKTEFSHNGYEFLLHAYRIFFKAEHFTMTEHTEWRWAAFEEIDSLDFADSDRHLFPALQAYLEAQAGVENG